MRCIIIVGVIKSFANKTTHQLFVGIHNKRLDPSLERRAKMKLAILNRVTALQELTIPPANRLEKLSGARAGQYSIRVNNQYRICFTWEDGNAYDVEFVDYH